jgi:hypothetical protein
MKVVLRFVSFALPSLVTIIALLQCWRLNFVERGFVLAAWEIAFSVYLAIFLNKRSHGRLARFFYVSNGPDRDMGWQRSVDVAALWVGALFFGVTVFLLVKDWSLGI